MHELSAEQETSAIVAAWLRGDSDEIYPRFVRIVQGRSIDQVLAALPADLRQHLLEWMAENASELRQGIRDWVNERTRHTYEEAARRTDPEDLHDVLVARGPSILTRDLPYIVQACRWRSFDRSRRARKDVELDYEHAEFETFESAFEQLANDERLGRLRSHLAQLANLDVAILWRTADGLDDKRIGEVLGMSTEAVRQRRHRAIRRLQHLVKKADELP